LSPVVAFFTDGEVDEAIATYGDQRAGRSSCRAEITCIDGAIGTTISGRHIAIITAFAKF
jgi:hypothetical protein